MTPGYAPRVRFPGGAVALLLAGAGRTKNEVRRRVWFFNSTRKQPVEIVEIEAVQIVKMDWPEPASEPLFMRQEYYALVAPLYLSIDKFWWSNSVGDHARLRHGLIHLTLEDAQAHADGLLALSK